MSQENKRRMLIVGSPSSGKTVLLIRIALELANDARKNLTAPLPVVFNLAAWSANHEDFGSWLRNTLVRGYGLNVEVAREMLERRQVVFLFDGLDELARNESPASAAHIRASCLMSLNEYLSHGAMQVVVCCREKEFAELQALTRIDAPVGIKVSIQDLDRRQIEKALRYAAQSSDGNIVHNNIAAGNILEQLNTEFRHLYLAVLRTPFYFTTALEVFDFSRPKLVRQTSVPTLAAHIINAYVDKKLGVLKREGVSPGRTRKWRLPTGTLIVATDSEGRILFNTLRHHRSKASAIRFNVFDLLIHSGRNILHEPLSRRRDALTSCGLSRRIVSD